MKHVLTNIALLCVLCAVCGSTVAASRDLLAHGSPQSYWIARVQKGDAQPPITGPGAAQQPTTQPQQTSIQMRAIATGDSKWKRIAQISARVVSMTNRGPDLAVLLEGGDWMLVWDGGSSSGQLPEDGAKLLQLAGDRDTLWAIAAARQGRTPTSRAASQPAATMPAGTLMLYRLDHGQWNFVAPLPDTVNGSADISLALINNLPTVAVLTSDARVSAYTLGADQRSLVPAGVIQTTGKATRVKLLADLGRPALCVGDDHAANSAIFVRNDEAWSAAIPLVVPPEATSKADAADITVAGQSIRLLLLLDAEAAGDIREFSFAIDGASRGHVNITAPSASSPGDSQPREWLSVIAIAMLMLVLVNSMRAPRPVIDPAKLEEAGVVLAPYGLRLLAAAIDALPILITAAIVVSRLSPTELQNTDSLLDATKWPRYLSAGGYLLHTLLTEVLWGWTIGKWICGLRAVTFAGTTPTRTAFMWRNLLRLIDVAMGFTALLIFISPLRQRVGDVAAETIVVLKPEKESPTSESKDQES